MQTTTGSIEMYCHTRIVNTPLILALLLDANSGAQIGKRGRGSGFMKKSASWSAEGTYSMLMVWCDV